MQKFQNRIALYVIVTLPVVASAAAQGAIRTQTIEYQAGIVTLEGYFAYDDVSEVKRPAILVVHEWWGNNDYPRKRAEQLAQLGYAALAIDMYGKGKTTDDPKQAAEWAGAVEKDAAIEKERFDAAINVLKQQPVVDANRLAAIGYCFGGTMVLDMARMGQKIKGVVSFHGGLSSEVHAQGPIAAKILVCTGEADRFVPESQLAQFEDEMKKAGADYKIIRYPGAHHAFTNPAADSHHLDNIAYNAQADQQSWQAMKEFLADLFK